MCWLRSVRGATTTSVFVRQLKLSKLPDVEFDAGRSLRGVDFAHRLSERQIWEIEIGVDELISASKGPFIIGFWSADQRFIADNENPLVEPLDAEFIEVNVPGGKLPIEYINGINVLPQFKTTLTQKYPD